MCKAMHCSNDEGVAFPGGLRRLHLNAPPHHDRVLRFGSIERVDETERRLHIAARKERVLDCQPVHLLGDTDVRPPTASHVAADSRAATSSLSDAAGC